MIFTYFRKFVPERQSAEDYLGKDLERNFTDLQTGLNNGLSFKNNLDGFFANLSFLSGETVQIANRMNTIPSGFLVIRQKGNGLITEPTDRNWSQQQLWLKNNGSVAVTATVFFLR